MRTPFASSSEPNLAKIVLFDLLTTGKFSLILLIVIFITAMGVVFTTHQSRQVILERANTMAERERLNEEWRNLLLEETALSEHSRVQDLASKELDMKRPDPDKEIVISLK